MNTDLVRSADEHVFVQIEAMLAFTLTCTQPDCGAVFEVFAPTADHGVTVCEYCRLPLLDVSFLDPDGCPDDDAATHVIVRQGPRMTGPQLVWAFP